MVPVGVGRELVRDQPAERARIEVLGVPGRQPRPRPVVPAHPSRPAPPPVPVVDHRVPPDRTTVPGPTPRTVPWDEEARTWARIHPIAPDTPET